MPNNILITIGKNFPFFLNNKDMMPVKITIKDKTNKKGILNLLGNIKKLVDTKYNTTARTITNNHVYILKKFFFDITLLLYIMKR